MFYAERLKIQRRNTGRQQHEFLRCLAGSKKNGNFIGQRSDEHNNSRDELIAFSDADWAGERTDRKSTSGFVIFLNGGIVSWNTQKQKCVSLSSTEAEYVALAECIKNVTIIQSILEELVSDCTLNPTTVFEDNQSCTSWILNLGKRGKHTELRCHYSKLMSEEGKVEIKYCPTSEMIADLFTKR